MRQVQLSFTGEVNDAAPHAQIGGSKPGANPRRMGIVLVSTALGVLAHIDLLNDVLQAHGENQMREALSDKPLASGHHESPCDKENVTLHVNRGPGTGDS